MDGKERRAQIDAETLKGLLIINGGGVVALLALLPSFLEEAKHLAIARAILIGVIVLMVGLFFAVLHNYLRRLCDAANEYCHPTGKLFGFPLSEPRVCFSCWLCMRLSLLAFTLAGTVVAVVGLATI